MELSGYTKYASKKFFVKSVFCCPAIGIRMGNHRRGKGGAAAPPTKLLGEQVIHPAPQLFSVLFQIFWATSHTLVIVASMAVRNNSSCQSSICGCNLSGIGEQGCPLPCQGSRAPSAAKHGATVLKCILWEIFQLTAPPEDLPPEHDDTTETNTHRNDERSRWRPARPARHANLDEFVCFQNTRKNCRFGK